MVTDITTVMENMGSRKRDFALFRIVNLCLLVLCFGAVLFGHKAYAFDWRLRPNLSMGEIFSDNLNLSADAKKSGFVTEVSPGLSLYGQSPWSNFNLNYRMQGLYNAGGNEAVDINHQLQMDSLYQLIRNTFFIQASSSISQQNASNAFIATDNISGDRNRVETKNFSISPYLTPHFGRYGTGLLKVSYDQSSFDNANNSQGSTTLNNSISDSDTISKQAGFSSGSYFNRVKWNLNYSSEKQNRVSGNDVLFEQYMADARYFINRKFNVFAQAGEENNDYQTLNKDAIKNGFFYTVGGQWRPSYWYSLEAGVGNNKHVTMQFNPLTNLTSTVTYRNKDVGLNLGDSWDANLNYRAAQGAVGFKYSQETTTVQQTLIEQGINTNQGFVSLTSPQALALSQLGLGSFIVNQANFVDDVLIIKHGDLNFSYWTGKSTYNATLYNERRTYEASAGEDNVYGASAGWQWQYAPRLNFYLQPLWQHTETSLSSVTGGGSTTNTRYDVALGVTRGIPINLGRPLLMNTKFELRHIEQISDDAEFDYTENRATANFTVQF